MTYPHRPTLPSWDTRTEPQQSRPWTVRPKGLPQQVAPVMRRFNVLWLDRHGQIDDLARTVPGVPAFDAAFAAFARGALVATPNGPVAVEDLLPGQNVLTRTGPQPVRWIGNSTLPPSHLRQHGSPEVFRISAESFGSNSPMPDVLLCSGAYLARRAPAMRACTGLDEALVPVAEFVDGIGVIQINAVSPIQGFHIALDSHAIINVNGIEVDTYHPGRKIPDVLVGETLARFLSLFPHLDGLSGFGPLCSPRLGLEAISAFSAA